MIPLPALPLPKIYRAIDVYHAKSFCRWFGIILVAQWILPGSGGFFANVGGTLWAVIGGAAMITLSFLNNPALKLGHYFFVAAGVGVLGILWGGAAFAAFWPYNLFGMIGIVGVGVGSFLWMRNGWSSQIMIWNIVGLSGLALGLLIPVGGYGGLPLLTPFKLFGVGGKTIITAIFAVVLTLAYLAIVVNWVLQVFLKKENADAEQVERHALVLFFFPLVMTFIIGFFTLFNGFSDSLKAMLTDGIYTWLAIWGIVNVLEQKEKGTLGELMTTPL
ncbi:MAG: hypothetical protein U1F43_06945 [Myxococcota bacterium]